MFRGLFLKKFQTGFKTILKLLPKNTCTRLSCVKFMGRYIHQFSFYERFSKFLDKNISKISKIHSKTNTKGSCYFVSKLIEHPKYSKVLQFVIFVMTFWVERKRHLKLEFQKLFGIQSYWECLLNQFLRFSSIKAKMRGSLLITSLLIT